MKSLGFAQTDLELLGQRAQQLRLALALKQSEFSALAGVSIATLQRFEAGSGIQLGGFLRILRALEPYSGQAILDRMLPAPSPSPLALLKLGRAQRRRVRSPTTSTR
jgi:transcriptional regulator with XRE-family HTH domain